MKFDSENERKAISTLCDIAQQMWSQDGYSSGDWPELESALKLINPLIDSDFDIEEFLE